MQTTPVKQHYRKKNNRHVSCFVHCSGSGVNGYYTLGGWAESTESRHESVDSGVGGGEKWGVVCEVRGQTPAKIEVCSFCSWKMFLHWTWRHFQIDFSNVANL